MDDMINFIFKKDFNSLIQQVTEIYDNLLMENKRLIKENELLHSEHYKDHELSELQKKVDDLTKYRQFVPLDSEWNKAEEWRRKHENFNCRVFHYEFHDYAMGTAGEIVCNSCGERFTFKWE